MECSVFIILLEAPYSLLFSLKVCQGSYDPILLKAWETWDTVHGSENDKPDLFPDKQVCIPSADFGCFHAALLDF